MTADTSLAAARTQGVSHVAESNSSSSPVTASERDHERIQRPERQSATSAKLAARGPVSDRLHERIADINRATAAFDRLGSQGAALDRAGGGVRPLGVAEGGARPLDRAGGGARPLSVAGGGVRPLGVAGGGVRPLDRAGGAVRPLGVAEGGARPLDRAGGGDASVPAAISQSSGSCSQVFVTHRTCTLLGCRPNRNGQPRENYNSAWAGRLSKSAQVSA